jgi:hypothetical protein
MVLNLQGGSRYYPATAKADGLLKAADYARMLTDRTKLATLQAPVLRLAYTGGDLLNGAALGAGTLVDLQANQNFTVSSTASVLLAHVRTGVLVTAAGAFNCALRALIDGTQAEKLSNEWGAASTFVGLNGGSFAMTGLSAGTHTIKLQVRADVAATGYCRGASAATYEFCLITIEEYNV